MGRKPPVIAYLPKASLRRSSEWSASTPGVIDFGGSWTSGWQIGSARAGHPPT